MRFVLQNRCIFATDLRWIARFVAHLNSGRKLHNFSFRLLLFLFFVSSINLRLFNSQNHGVPNLYRICPSINSERERIQAVLKPQSDIFETFFVDLSFFFRHHKLNRESNAVCQGKRKKYCVIIFPFNVLCDNFFP